MSLLSTPTAAQSPSAISSGTLAQSSSTSKVHSPSPSRSAIVSSRSCSTIIGRACWTGESPREPKAFYANSDSTSPTSWSTRSWMDLRAQMDAEAQTISASAAIKNWRNQLLDMFKTGQTQAVIAFGAGAHKVVDLWPGAAGLFVAKPLHPSFRDDAGLRADWNSWLPQIRAHVTPDVPPDMTTYAGSTFKGRS